jgi:ribose transport system permease protein
VKKRLSWDYLVTHYPAFFPLILLVIAIAINLFLQPNMLDLDTLNSNMRVFLPLILLTVGQAIVLIGGGIAINGFFIAFLRLQPIITTYATSFLYAGFALFILPNPGGGIPADIANLYRTSTPLRLPLAFYVVGVVILVWIYVSNTRYGKYLFAVGGKAQAAYETAVPVILMQFSTYIVSGLLAALAGIAITMLSGSGNADIGNPMTLNSITAAVIGGNAFSGGIGGVVGPVMGAVTLSLIQNIISFAHIDTWWETLVKATIIVVALAAPGTISLFRRRRS